MTSTPAVNGSHELARFLTSTEAETQQMDPEAASIAIIAEILEATSADDILGSRDTVASKDYARKPFRLLGVKFNQSRLEGEGPGFYAVLHGVNGDGEKVTITSSARSIMAQAWKLRDLGALPVDVMIERTDKPTEAGFYPHWLERAPLSL